MKNKITIAIIILLIIGLLIFGAFSFYKTNFQNNDEVKPASTITINYYKNDTTDKLMDSKTMEIIKGDYYEAPAESPIETADGETYVITSTTGNTSAVANEDNIEVNYYYKKK